MRPAWHVGAVLAATILGGATTARADLVTADAADLMRGPQIAVAGLAFEPVPLVEVGYIRPGALVVRQRPIDLGASLEAPLFLIPRAQDVRVVVAARAPAIVAGRFQLGAALSAFFATATDSLATSRAFGFAASATPRYVAERWFAGARLEVRSTALLHLTNSDLARSAYADRYDHGATNAPDPSIPRLTAPHDGWYAWTAGRALLGLEAGRRLGAALVLTAGAGAWWAPQAEGLYAALETGQIPIYARLSAHLAF